MAAFVNAVVNLRQLAQAPPAKLDIASIPSRYMAILANPRAKFCFLAVFLEGVAVFGLFPFVALLLLAAGEPQRLHRRAGDCRVLDRRRCLLAGHHAFDAALAAARD